MDETPDDNDLAELVARVLREVAGDSCDLASLSRNTDPQLAERVMDGLLDLARTADRQADVVYALTTWRERAQEWSAETIGGIAMAHLKTGGQMSELLGPGGDLRKAIDDSPTRLLSEIALERWRRAPEDGLSHLLFARAALAVGAADFPFMVEASVGNPSLFDALLPRTWDDGVRWIEAHSNTLDRNWMMMAIPALINRSGGVDDQNGYRMGVLAMMMAGRAEALGLVFEQLSLAMAAAREPGNLAISFWTTAIDDALDTEELNALLAFMPADMMAEDPVAENLMALMGDDPVMTDVFPADLATPAFWMMIRFGNLAAADRLLPRISGDDLESVLSDPDACGLADQTNGSVLLQRRNLADTSAAGIGSPNRRF